MTGPEAPAARPVRVLELYCGIGGCAAALAELAGETGVETEVVAALDIDRRAVAVYGRSFGAAWRRGGGAGATPGRDLRRRPGPLPRRPLVALAPLPALTPAGPRAGTTRTRAPEACSRLIDRLAELGARGDGPEHLALENVPGFRGSRVHGRLLEVLDRHGWRFREATLCPTELGVPNRRERWYLAASRDRRGRRLSGRSAPTERRRSRASSTPWVTTSTAPSTPPCGSSPS